MHFLGINVCLPSPAACLKEVAKQISDRDNAVRNAALNCVVQAYYIVGDKVYKMVGQVSNTYLTGMFILLSIDDNEKYLR